VRIEAEIFRLVNERKKVNENIDFCDDKKKKKLGKILSFAKEKNFWLEKFLLWDQKF